MQTNSTDYRFSWLAAVLGLVALVAGFIVMLLLPGIRYAAWGILALGVILLATAFILDFRRVGRALAGKRGRFGVGTTVMAAIFIGIILFVNAISIGSYHRFDATSLAQFTLAPQTKEVLTELNTPVQALCFFVPNDPYGLTTYATALLTEYQNYTDQLSVEYIDPDEHPDQARAYGVTQYQTVVFESQDRRRLVSPAELVTYDDSGNLSGIQAEHPFTSAILEVSGKVQKKVYFLTGHGESSISSEYSYAAEGLRDDLYIVGTLNLIKTPSIPEDCAALLIVAPRQSMISSEIEIIKHYLNSGGQVLILINPGFPQDIGQLVSSWGADIEDGTAIDASSYLDPNKDIPTVTQERCAFGLPATYFPGAVALIPQEEAQEREGHEMMPLVWTTKESWLEQDIDPEQEPTFNEETEREGPFSLGILIAAAPTEGPDGGEPTAESKVVRLVVIGDSDFASNAHYYNGNNSDLFLNSVSWLTEETELISIRHNVLPFRRLVVGPEAASFINYSSIGLLPLIILIVGGIIWWRRRQ